VHNDDNNPILSSLEKFGVALKSFAPHLIIVCGLQMLDNFPFKPGVLLLCRYLRRMSSALTPLLGHLVGHLAVSKDLLLQTSGTTY